MTFFGSLHHASATLTYKQAARSRRAAAEACVRAAKVELERAEVRDNNACMHKHDDVTHPDVLDFLEIFFFFFSFEQVPFFQP